jgi:hypothetical protein
MSTPLRSIKCQLYQTLGSANYREALVAAACFVRKNRDQSSYWTVILQNLKAIEDHVHAMFGHSVVNPTLISLPLQTAKVKE